MGRPPKVHDPADLPPGIEQRGPGVFKIRVYAGYEEGRIQARSRIVRGTLDEAKKERASLITKLAERKEPVSGTATIAELLEEYYADHAWESIGGKRKCREDFDRYLIPHLGHHLAGRFTDEPIRVLYRGLRTKGPKCLAKQKRPLGDGTLRRLHNTLHAALEWNVERGNLGWNPASKVEVPKQPATKVVIPAADEMAELREAASPADFACFVRLAMATGRRRQDVLALQLPDIILRDNDLVFCRRLVDPVESVAQRKRLSVVRRQVLHALSSGPAENSSGRAVATLALRTGHEKIVSLSHVLASLEAEGLITRTRRQTRTYKIEATELAEGALEAEDVDEGWGAGGPVVEDLDKNGLSARLDIDDDTMEAVKAQIVRLRERADACGVKLIRRAWLFTDDPAGRRPWQLGSTSHKFSDLTKALDMDYTLHSLRHAHITELLEAGHEIEKVAARVGDLPATIWKTYFHFRKNNDRTASAIMGKVLGGKQTAVGLRVIQGGG